ncbi:MAG: adenylyl-sulfate reductase [Usitatibacter sp.]
MFTNNPFAAAAPLLPAGFLQWYLVVMVVLVIAGTIIDVVHKGSARYFFANMRKPRGKATRQIGGGEMLSIAAHTAIVDVMASGEFCNTRRRIAHLLTMWGFLLYLATTVILVFRYSTAATPAPEAVPMLWWIGAAMVAVGGYWFWFFIRVDVAAEGKSRWRIVRADLFVLSLLASVTLGIAWAWNGGGAGVLFWLYLLATTVLFGSVFWSKFAHMFFKPAAAFEKRLSNANGTAENLPQQTRDDPEQQKKHSMELLRDAPMDMGLGIKREAPHHY